MCKTELTKLCEEIILENLPHCKKETVIRHGLGIPDFIITEKLNNKIVSICIELKTSWMDLVYSSSGKNLAGLYNYIAMPNELYDKVKTSRNIKLDFLSEFGIICVDTINRTLKIADEAVMNPYKFLFEGHISSLNKISILDIYGVPAKACNLTNYIGGV